MLDEPCFYTIYYYFSLGFISSVYLRWNMDQSRHFIFVLFSDGLNMIHSLAIISEGLVRMMW